MYPVAGTFGATLLVPEDILLIQGRESRAGILHLRNEEVAYDNHFSPEQVGVARFAR